MNHHISTLTNQHINKSVNQKKTVMMNEDIRTLGTPYVHAHDVSVVSKGGEIKFEFLTRTDMARIYGIAFGIPEYDKSKGTTASLSINNKVLIDNSGSGVELSLFAHSDSKVFYDTMLRVDEQAGGVPVTGKITDGGLQDSFKAYTVKIYLIGIKT